jgi:uncharacterized protein (TIGR03032 family)
MTWLVEHHMSLAFTTYQAGKVFLIGCKPDGQMSVFERSLERCMGMVTNGQSLWISSSYQLWRFENVLERGQRHDSYDRLYVPQMCFVTGDLDIHDIALDQSGEPIFVNTLFSCLARPSPTKSFVPVWKPSFISRLAAEDRCHLNGLALRDGKPAYVTLVGPSDVADGWRDHRRAGGQVIDVVSGETVLSGLSMPHSPRWHDGKLWFLNSGTGEFGFADLANGSFQPVAFCPGYARGLAFVGHFAVIGLSRPRAKNLTFEGLALGECLTAKGAEARCGLHIIDLTSGDAVHTLRVDGVVEELYDVVVIPGARAPMAVGFKTDEIKRVISIGEAVIQ